jgi:hypothetical protein
MAIDITTAAGIGHIFRLDVSAFIFDALDGLRLRQQIATGRPSSTTCSAVLPFPHQCGALDRAINRVTESGV